VTRRVKRVDPYWLASPAVLAFAAAAAAVALFGARTGRPFVAIAGAAALGAAVFAATKPALSGVFAVFGLIGGLVTFIAGPSAGLTPPMRLLATAGFSVFYMVLMDGVVISVSAIYNLFTRAGFTGFALEVSKGT
jgi:hypothetical protein